MGHVDLRSRVLCTRSLDRIIQENYNLKQLVRCSFPTKTGGLDVLVDFYTRVVTYSTYTIY